MPRLAYYQDLARAALVQGEPGQPDLQGDHLLIVQRLAEGQGFREVPPRLPVVVAAISQVAQPPERPGLPDQVARLLC